MSKLVRVTAAKHTLAWVWMLGGFFTAPSAVAQEVPALGVEAEDPATRRLDLSEVVRMAKEQSPSYQQALTQLENRTWQYQTYKSNYLPQLKLNATLPDYVNSINPVVQPSGSIEFRPQHNSTTYAELALSQNIGLTGGVVSINSNLKRIDDFKPKPGALGHSYASTPAVITLNQPLFGHNGLKWDRRIEPLRFEEAKRNFWEEMERISIRATDLYFTQLQSQIGFDIASKNVANNDTLFKIAQNRFFNAKISVNELLQLELSLLTSRQSLEQAKLDIETSTLRLKSYLGITDDRPIRLSTPDAIPQFEVDEEFALKQALENRSRMVGIKREELEAERSVDWAEGDTGFNASLFLQYGLVQQSTELMESYQDPSEQQRVRVGFSLPIMDWGRTKSRLGTARANLKLVKGNLEQQKANFNQDVYLQIKRFKMLREQMKIAQQANGLAERRFLGAKDRYLSGKIGILELNQASTERDSARRSYVSSLRNFWDSYYNIRLQTLYDFETNQPLLLPMPF
ncbi:TolC family protein [Rufibacter glacialis]|uniref:TolC family protein n=1 Tax=Rufibacter glacialis TaxID=1259555 RepID=A0A5M8QMJ2_9BACT|nr:TolC family protein [Rufibacter glacialis]KAA6437437.1 TolC family protein [Rufibacter glacialis]